VHVVVGVPDRNPVDTGVSSTLGEMRCRSPNTVSRSPGVGIIAGWDDVLHFVDYERTALGCFDGGVGCGAQESGQSEQSSDLDLLGIGQCFDLIDTESVSTASNLVSSNDRRAVTFATDQRSPSDLSRKPPAISRQDRFVGWPRPWRWPATAYLAGNPPYSIPPYSSRQAVVQRPRRGQGSEALITGVAVG
jgi:hypothetical protein